MPALEMQVTERKAREKSKPKPARASGGLYFGAPKMVEAGTEKPIKVKAPKKNDPALAAKARELRDRWLEQVNATGGAPLLGQGKYDVSRPLQNVSEVSRQTRLLERAA